MATTQSPLKRAVSNYLVPINGGTHAMKFRQDFSTPLEINWAQADLDGLAFNPSGFYCDNAGGVDAILITVVELELTIIVPVGAILCYQYPGPVGHSLTITGANIATIVFVDYPVIPFLIQAA